MRSNKARKRSGYLIKDRSVELTTNEEGLGLSRLVILKATGYIQKGLNASKFIPKWEGPYIIRENLW